MYGRMKEYSPLVETYIQNLKPDKELGSVPAGDNIFFGQTDLSKTVYSRLPHRYKQQGQEIFSGIGNFFSFAHAVPARRFLADDFHRHQRFRHAALQVRLRAPRISW